MAIAVVQAAHGQLCACVGTQTSALIGKQTTHPGVKPITAVNSTALVVDQTGNVNVQAAGSNQPCTVVERLYDFQAQGLVAEQLASAVVQAVGSEREAVSAGNFAAAVVNAIELVQRQLASGVDQTTVAVVEVAVAQIQDCIAIAVKAPLLMLVEAGDTGSEGLGTGNGSTLAVDHRAGRQFEGATAGEHAMLLVVEGAGVDLCGGTRFDAALLLIIQRAGSIQPQVALAGEDA